MRAKKGWKGQDILELKECAIAFTTFLATFTVTVTLKIVKFCCRFYFLFSFIFTGTFLLTKTPLPVNTINFLFFTGTIGITKLRCRLPSSFFYLSDIPVIGLFLI